MTLFVLLAALMLSIALAFLMLPLLRRRGRADNGEAEPVPASNFSHLYCSWLVS